MSQVDDGQREQKRKCTLKEREKVARDHLLGKYAGIMKQRKRIKALRVLVECRVRSQKSRVGIQEDYCKSRRKRKKVAMIKL